MELIFSHQYHSYLFIAFSETMTFCIVAYVQTETDYTDKVFETDLRLSTIKKRNRLLGL